MKHFEHLIQSPADNEMTALGASSELSGITTVTKEGNDANAICQPMVQVFGWRNPHLVLRTQ